MNKFRKLNRTFNWALAWTILYGLLILYMFICYFANIYMLINAISNNDTANHIVIHAIGLIPVVSCFTVWF